MPVDDASLGIPGIRDACPKPVPRHHPRVRLLVSGGLTLGCCFKSYEHMLQRVDMLKDLS